MFILQQMVGHYELLFLELLANISTNGGIVSGTVGAAGNLGGIIFNIVFRYNGVHYNLSIWIVGVICMVTNLAVCLIRPVPNI
jgi:nitrate/nitrite transporter NarK